MAWFRCSCGHIAEVEPVAGEIVSVYHLHGAARLDKSALLERMELLPDPLPEPVLAGIGAASR
jgi:hypothetical protein